MNILLTGIRGFMCQYFSFYLVNKGNKVFGRSFTPPTSMLLLNNSKMYECDIRDSNILQGTTSLNQETSIRKTLEDRYNFWLKELEGRDE